MRWFTRPAPLVPVDVDASAPVPAPPRARLLAVAAEAVILQDRAEDVLALIRAHTPLGQTARRAGRLVGRFFELREELPPVCADPDEERLRALLSTLLHHHAELLSLATELSAYEWRSDRLRRQVETLVVGEPGRRLEQAYAELARAPVVDVLATG